MHYVLLSLASFNLRIGFPPFTGWVPSEIAAHGTAQQIRSPIRDHYEERPCKPVTIFPPDASIVELAKMPDVKIESCEIETIGVMLKCY
jgi:hypothetical protein